MGAATWLDRVRVWMADRLDLAAIAEGASSETVTLRRADLEAFRNGLGQAVSLLDSLTVDPARLPLPTEPPVGPDATPTTTATTGRLH